MDKNKYSEYLKNKHKDFESICIQCGVCCGANDGDPCKHLKKDKKGKFFCDIYENRLGPQETVSGKIFTCTTVRELIKNGVLRGDCAYNKVAGQILKDIKDEKKRKGKE